MSLYLLFATLEAKFFHQGVDLLSEWRHKYENGSVASLGPEVIKRFSCSTQLSMKLFLLKY